MLLKKEHIRELRSKKLIKGKHPTKQAYRIALETVDDTSQLVEDMMRHADYCNSCSLKVIAVLKERDEPIGIFRKERRKLKHATAY